jgi:DNA-binding NtrC family response regulator
VSNPLLSIKQRFGIVGRSLLLDAALDTAVRVAPTDLTVLITGESGVGKEAFSKVIHSLSARKHNTFIAVNCGAIPEGTINSELFGHEKGAFTGAVNDRKGWFETVNGGTIFLDEIGEMPLDTQAYLLRILESGEFMKVGSSKVEKTDVRIIAATNVNLDDRVQKGRFREDLFYRLSTVPIRVPALKDRREDINTLFRKFAVDFSEKYRSESVDLDDRAQLVLENYRWPGNIRELKNVAEQLSVLSPNRHVSAEKLMEMMPQLFSRDLPMAAKNRDYSSAFGGGMEEREILYKLLFDMKNDLNDLKTLVTGLIRSNNLRVPENSNLRQLSAPTNFEETDSTSERENNDYFFEKITQPPSNHSAHSSRPIILEQNLTGNPNNNFSKTEVVEENLSMEDMEKELIARALKKYHGRRKEAADEIGISERTLYRKIKQYELD